MSDLTSNEDRRERARANRERLRERLGARNFRRWQEKAVKHYFAGNKKRYLITGTPGSGKSKVGVEIARQLLEQGEISRIVVVVPTDHLKKQWAREFAKSGIDLDPNWSNGSFVEAKDYMGVIVTYQQVSAEPFIYDLNCEISTLVIFDEIHHAADGSDWGIKLNIAFARAEKILCLSGTPFRHDNNAIPYIRYDRHGKSIADYSYTYKDALLDGVCRPVKFPLFDGKAQFLDGRGILKSHDEFADLAKDQASELLRALLDPTSGWLRTVLREADEKLSEYRAAGHPDAAGLVFAMDQRHAKLIAKLLKELTREDPVIVISEDTDATRVLDDFRRTGNHKRWLVAVRMVSEGIDVPRLRVGVYATNVMSELFFRQAVGRFVRVIADLGEQEAAFYLPAHPTLGKHALQIMEERDHVLPHMRFNRNADAAAAGDGSGSPANNSSVSDDTAQSAAGDHSFEGDSAGDGSSNENNVSSGNAQSPAPAGRESDRNPDNPVYSRQVLITVTSEARYQETIFDGQRFSDAELGRARQYGHDFKLNASAEQIAALLRAVTAGLGAGGVINTGDQTAGNTQASAPAGNPSPAGNSSPATASQPSGASAAQSPAASTAPTGNSRVYSATVDAGTEVKTLSEQKKELRDVINKTTNVLAYRLNIKPGRIHGYWTHRLREPPNALATLADLQRKLNWLTAQLDETKRFSVDYNLGLEP